MKPVILLLPILAFALSAQKKSAAAQGLPPLIDRELLFGNPEIAGAQLSPDGKFIAFLKPWKETRNIWVKKTSEPFASARLLTTESKRPVAGFFWTRDGKYVLYVKDNDGDENFNLYAVDPAAATPSGADAPPSRDLTGLKGVVVQIYSVPKSDPDTAYIGINDRDKAWHDLYKLKISTGREDADPARTRRRSRPGCSISRASCAWRRTWPITATRRFCEWTPTASPRSTRAACSRIARRCAFTRTASASTWRPTRATAPTWPNWCCWIVATGKTETVEADPLKRVDFGNATFSDVTDELAVTTYLEDKPRRYFQDKSFEADFKWLTAKFPGKEIAPVSSTRDERLWLIGVNSDTDPGQVYLFDRKSKKVTLQYKVREKLNREWLASMEPIRYKSSDGLEIPAYLTLPKGVPAKNLPTLVVPHGGPWARDVWGYNSMAQFFANRGYAVLMPNFRGSTGYGKKFLNAGNGEWGRKMQDDITWGVKYLIDRGTSDPKRIGILGGSYGGYATLAGVAFTPDVYRAAVDIVGPSNLLTLLDAIPPYWEAGRKLMYARMADPDDSGGKGVDGGALAPALRGEDQDAAIGGAGRQRSARESRARRNRS